MNRLATTVVLAALLAVAGLRPAHAQIYVDKSANGANDGSSWADAYTDLQDAIDDADGSSQLWVAEGVYKPDGEGDSFTITGQKNGIEVYGGFDATESNRDERDPTANRTILSGDLNGDDADPDGDDIIEDASDLAGGENAHHVLVLDGGDRIGSNVGDNVTSSTVLDGLVITAGQADGSGPNGDGGGLYCDGNGSGNECSPTLANALFAGNEAGDGGAIFNDGLQGTSSPSVTGATFTGNTASGSGGAIHNDGDNGESSPSITNATFADNTASGDGGAIYNSGDSGESSPSITNATFADNEADERGGAMYNDGSGFNGTSSPSITNATFTGNTAFGSGGAIYNDGFNSGTSSPQVANTILWGNAASSDGDEIFNDDASATLTHTIIEGGVNGDGVGGPGSNNGDGTNLDQDPQFADASTPAGPDGTFATRGDGVNVDDNSPALDAGTNDSVSVSTDITGAARIQDRDGDNTATVNMGAYEVSLPPPPTADAVAPSAPYPGHPVTISGSNLSGASDVSYNGTSVAFTVESDSEIRARVPEGATTGASFEVTTDGGTATSATISLDTEPGLYGPRRALSLDGSGDYVEVAGFPNLTSSFTVSAWIKPGAASGTQRIVADDENTTSGWALSFGDPGEEAVRFYHRDVAGGVDTPTGTVETGTWHHVAAVLDDGAGEIRVYVDGKEEASTSFSGALGTDAGPLTIGGVSGRYSFEGEIDQARIWNGALTQAQVQERRHRTVQPGEAAFGELEAAWRLDAGGTTTAFEHTAEYRLGTFQGDPQRQAASGARLGQESASTTGSDATVGPSGGTLSATNVSAGSGEAVQLYRFGEKGGPPRTGSGAGEDLSGLVAAERSNLTWGLATNGSPSADLTIDYSGISSISGPVMLIRRDGPGAAWQRATGWTHDSGAQTFTTSGTVPEGQYAVASAVAYVDESASGAGDGSSWTDAYTDLQTAIDNATSSNEIWVAEGIYKPDGEDDSFTITGNKDGLEVYGGFDGTESTRDERDADANVTVLSGDIDGNDTTDDDGVTPTAGDISGTNAHHVLVLNGGEGIGSDVGDNVTSSTVLDGLVVTAGQADGGSSPDDDGGGLYCDGASSENECSPTLRAVVFAGNTSGASGAAVYADGGGGGTVNLTAQRSVFASNAAGGSGGGIAAEGEAAAVSVTNSLFVDNDGATGGGAINVRIGSSGPVQPQIVNSTFVDNTASGGGSNTRGGALSFFANTGTLEPTVANAILWGNTAPSGNQIGSNAGSGDLTLTVGHSIVEGAESGIAEANGAQTSYASSNLDQDPQFADASTPAGADGTYATKDDGVNVVGNSPALDTGDNGEIPSGVDEDITGADRTQDLDGDGTATVNIGAYEVPLEGPPIAQTDAPSTVRIRSAELGGTVNPANLGTTVTFEYRKTGASSFASATAAESPLDGTSDQAVSASVNGLDPDTEYEVKVVASNEEGTDEGTLVTFTTHPTAAPTAQTGSASGVGGTTADLGGTVNPKGLETSVQAQIYPTSDPSAVRTLTAEGSPLTGDTGQDITVALSGLRPGTEYRARVLATNSKGSVEGSSVTFTTTGDGYARSITGTDGTQNDAGWRMLALPAAGKDRSALEGDLEFSTNSGSILYRWTSGSWTAQTSSGDALPRGRGFMLYFFDDALDPIDAEGLPLAVGTGPEDQSSDHQVSSLSTGESFHLLGNPFDVAFDLSELNLSGQGFQETVQIWDPSSQSYTQVTQSGDQSDVVGAWQGFFVERDPNASTEGTSLTFSTAGKQGNDGDLIGSQSAALADTKRGDEKRLRLGLQLAVLDTTESDTAPPSPKADAAAPSRPVPDSLAAEAAATQSSNQSSDGAQAAEAEADTVGTGRLGLLLSSEATGGWDAYEASQLGPPGGGTAVVTLSSPLERGSDESIQRALASEPYPGESASVTVPVSMQAHAGSGQATLRLPESQREQVPPGWALRLTDTRAGEQADLLTEAYRFTLDEKGEAGGTAPPESRFRLAVGPRGALPTPDGLALEPPYPNPTTRSVTVEYAVPQDKADGAQLQLYDVLGRRVRTVSVKPGPHAQRLDVSGLASGVYVLRLTAEGAQQTRKLTVVR